MTITRPPLQYYGGKFLLADWIIQHLPKNDNYIEGCGGGASVILLKEPSPLEIYNDLNHHVFNFFMVLRDRPEELLAKLRLTPFSREEFSMCRTPNEDPLENARRFFVSSWMSISRVPFDQATGMRTNTYHGQSYSSAVHHFRDHVDGDNLLNIAKRLSRVQIENRDYREIIDRHDNQDATIYMDPPYVHSTRVDKSKYMFEWDNQQHRECAEILRGCEGCVVLSGYPSQLYVEEYEDFGWKRVDREAQVNGGDTRTECLWLSPITQERLDLPEQASLL